MEACTGIPGVPLEKSTELVGILSGDLARADSRGRRGDRVPLESSAGNHGGRPGAAGVEGAVRPGSAVRKAATTGADRVPVTPKVPFERGASPDSHAA